MSTLKQRFAELQTEKPEISQADLARATGAKPPSVSAWFSGDTKSMKPSTAAKAAAMYGVNALWLATGEGPKLLTTTTSNVKFSLGDESNVTEIQKRPRVPLISMIHAGELTDVLDIFHPGEAVVWVEPRSCNPSGNAYALKVDGDSMESHIPGALSILEGSILVVDPQVCAGPNDYVIAKDVVTQKANFRQLKTDGVRWYLKPLNSAYPTIEIDNPELRVIGRVMEIQPPVIKV